jgi:predicted glycoside hydrolase/deacetylase ChbG (UPF0249 family)
MKEERKIIIIADDFGFSSGINEGIVQLWKRNLISGASILVNSPHFLEAIKMARREKMEIGFHLNITQGKPILPAKKVKSLVNRKGEFLGKERLLFKAFLGRLDSREIAKEIEAQIKKIKSFNINPVFANSHQNVHLFPGIFEIFLRKVSQNKIPFVRYPQDAGFKKLKDLLSKPHRKLTLFLLGRLAFKKFIKTNIKSSNQCFSLTLKKDFNIDRFFDFLDSLGGDVIEVVTHPGYFEDNCFYFKTYLTTQREEELKFLLKSDLKKKMKKRGYKLVRFSDLL